MTPTQILHASDLMRALDAQPHELRAWLRLEPLASREKKRRIATVYTALDALFLSIIKKLDAAGFAPKALQAFSGSIYKALQHPVAAGKADKLLLYQSNSGCWKVGASPDGATAIELKISLRPSRLQLLRYTGAHLISGQTEMNLLASIQAKGTRRANNVGGGRRSLR